MTYIIKLQNLPQSANAADIREYFSGLSIPRGGVFIVGGENGNAFIKFRYIIYKLLVKSRKCCSFALFLLSQY